ARPIPHTVRTTDPSSPPLTTVGRGVPECGISKVRSPVEAGVAIRGARGTPGQTVTRAQGTTLRPTSLPTPPPECTPFHSYVGPSPTREQLLPRRKTMRWSFAWQIVFGGAPNGFVADS